MQEIPQPVLPHSTRNRQSLSAYSVAVLILLALHWSTSGRYCLRVLNSCVLSLLLYTYVPTVISGEVGEVEQHKKIRAIDVDCTYTGYTISYQSVSFNSARPF